MCAPCRVYHRFSDDIFQPKSRQPRLFLHGTLHVTIKEARNLPNCDYVSLIQKNRSDPYVNVDAFDGARYVSLVRTRTIENDLNPKWQETYRLDVAHVTEELVLRVEDKDLLTSDDYLGGHRFGIDGLMSGKRLDGWFALQGKKGQQMDASINLSMYFQPASALKKSLEVQGVYFPARPGCSMTLYQDSHTPTSSLEGEIRLADGQPWKPRNLFEDISEAINKAEQFVFITGWAMTTHVSLLREGDGEVTFKELLIKTAERGVKVLLMLWNESFSAAKPDGIGFAGTHDEETARAFEGTGVHVELVRRHKANTDVLDAAFTRTFYSHHQKSIIFDSENLPSGARRTVMAFVGGLDIHEGRWDTPSHELFTTLNKEHRKDFYNQVADVRREAGPREPWHDVHSKIEGRAALDVLENFVERWTKQVSETNKQLVKLDKDKLILGSDAKASKAGDWTTQIFRSINMDSVAFDPEKSSALAWRKGRAKDDSTQRAYVHHIRRADNYIYIENQYFWGGSHAWDVEEAKARQLIPLEIAAKICQKIAEGSRLGAYIIVPMFPGGPMNPDGPLSEIRQKLTEEFLYWQAKTIQMMYRMIAEAIARHRAPGSPTDFLNFYCLGKRELEVPDGLAKPKSDDEELLRKHRRLLIYVHSKMMIVDDEYVLLGSSNAGQRSQSGDRDTEMDMGSWQPRFTVDKCGGLPKGDVHGFRMSLWAEHTGGIDQKFLDPGSLECVRHVNEIAASNWDNYVADDPRSLKGHLLRYPIHVAQDGTVTALPQSGQFPDSSVKVLGKNSGLINNKLTV